LRKAPIVFWEDLEGQESKVNWPFFDLPRWPGPSVQGGQLLIDLKAAWKMFTVFHWLCQHSNWSFKGGYGDQDQWRVALAVTKQSYHSIGRAAFRNPAFDCKVDGKSYVVHRCQSKLFPSPDPYPSRNDLLPMEARVFELFDPPPVPGSNATEVFGHIYANDAWNFAGEEQSKPGLRAEMNRPFVRFFNTLIEFSQAKSVVDLGCGDGGITRQLVAETVHGVDCIYLNPGEYGNGNCDHFHKLDLDADRDQLPAGDLAILKDVLHHWPNALILDWLAWARACGKWRWLVLVNDHRQDLDGGDCTLGGYRGLNPALSPLKHVNGLVSLVNMGHKKVLLLKCDK
jgi:hypothetical protein